MFHKTPSTASPAVLCASTDGQTGMTNLIVAFRNFANGQFYIYMIYVMIYDMIYGMIWYMMIWYDMWCDVMWCDVMWCGMVWYDIWYDMIWYGMIYDTIWYMIWYDMIYDIWYVMWCGMVWYHIYNMIWYGMIWYDILYDMIRYDIFNCNWAATRWQLFSIHIHTNNTENVTKQKNYYFLTARTGSSWPELTGHAQHCHVV
jgi:hypothetical protein